MNWVTSQSMMTLDWNLRKLYLKCMEIHGEHGNLGSWRRSTLPEHCLWGFLGSRATLLSPALLNEGGTDSALSQVSNLFRSRASGQGAQKWEDFQGTSQALCSYLPWATRLPLSRLSNWETNPDWLKLLSDFALYLDLTFWKSQNPNFSLFFFSVVRHLMD